MNTHQALYKWFNSFGIPFYTDDNVPHDVQFPYGTYQDIVNGYGDESATITVRLYYYTTKNTDINAMADKIGEVLSNGGIQIVCAKGSLWITKGIPFCQAVVDKNDISYKSRYININIDYITN